MNYKLVESSYEGLFNLYVYNDKKKEEEIPLLIESFHIETLKEMLGELKLDPNIPFNYYRNIIAGCAKIAITKSRQEAGL